MRTLSFTIFDNKTTEAFMEEKALVDIYREVLADIDTRFLTRGDKAGLSGLFLPSMPDCYASARNKVMVVGCETRAWYVKLPKKDENFLHGYIDSAMDTHRQHLVCELKKSKSRGRSFFNFMRDVSAKVGQEGLVYSNLLCNSWQKKSPLKSPDLEEIVHCSEHLLKAQIKFLQPDLIIFANGIASAAVRRSFFPIDDKNSDRACYNSRDFSEQGVRKHHLWAFDLDVGLDRRIPCYRIHHPSARAPEADLARKFLLGLLPSESQISNGPRPQLSPAT
tara:strand:- start:757 stop:1590 length:834 start_codon:yes stop_codon:yes gene_type:complete